MAALTDAGIDKEQDIVNEKFVAQNLYLNNNPYLEVGIIGGRGGDAFNLYGGDDGSMLEKIGVWEGEWQIKSVKIWLTNGSIRQFGKPFGPYKEYAFQPGELITSMSLWGNGAGTRLGAIKFATNKNGSFFAKMTDWGLKQEHPIDVGSGVCVGVMGRCKMAIDSMGFIFIKRLRSSTMIDMNYPTIGFDEANVQMKALKSVGYNNSLEVPQSFTLEDTTTTTTKEFWSVTAGIEFSYSVSVKAGIPELAETSTGWSLKVSVSGTYGMENTETKTVKWSFPINIPSKTNANATISMGSADIDLPYTARLVLTTTDGSELIIPVKGVYTGVAFTRASVDIAEV